MADTGWPEALERLVAHPGERNRLARRAREWARRSRIEPTADRWERLLTELAERPAGGEADVSGVA